MTFTSILIFLIILFLLVTVHELGHFLFAKYFKMRVDEFAFGFPPSLFRRKIGDTIYSLNLIPLGGYVKILGENGLDEEELKNLNQSDREKLFSSKPKWQRILVLCGGVLFNILAAIIFFTISLTLGSQEAMSPEEFANPNLQNKELILAYVDERSSLNNSAISLGDKIISLESDQDILDSQSLNSTLVAEFIQTHQNSAIKLNFINSKNELQSVTTFAKPGIVDGKKVLGAKFAETAYVVYPLPQAFFKAIEVTYYQIVNIFAGIYNLVLSLLFKNAKVEDNLSGPIGLAVMTAKVAERGVSEIFTFAAMLSLSLAVFNILPIPALDGGRVLFVLVEFFRRKKVKASTEQLFHGLGFLALLCLMVFVSYFDIVKAFT